MAEYTGKVIEIFNDVEGEGQNNLANVHTVLPIRITDHKEQLYRFAGITNLVYDPVTGYFALDTEEIEPAYGSEITIDSGLLACYSNIDAGNKRLTIQLSASTEYDNIDGIYQYEAFEYDAKAFYKITFDYQVVLSSSYFILELLDDTGAVKWSKNGSASGTNQVVNMVSTSWTFRVRCKADVTTDLLFNNWVYIDNIRLERYKDSGSVQQGWWHHIENLADLGKIGIVHTDGAEETNLKAQMLWSDDGETYGAWTGPGGSTATYYTEHGKNDMDPGTYMGYYFRTWVWFESDGRYTPTLKAVVYALTITTYRTPNLLNISQQGMDPGVSVAFTPLDWNRGTKTANDYLHLSDRVLTRRPNLLQVSQIGAVLTIPVAFTPLDWNRGNKTANDYLHESGRVLIKARSFRLRKSWAEAVWGVVLSGYCRDQNNELILSGKQIILECTTQTGKDTLGSVDPETGLFQVFIKDAVYDKRHLIVGLEGKSVDLALSEYGEPKVLDVSEGYPENQDLHFWKEKLCRSVAHVGSLVTY